ncbi:Holliday junction resolvase RuvX [Paucihalobacter ruber]|uniref:Putative pre-16S rRNA nuclease n=1 Tax=Paucihalobacter ruber TaxID=2567861 RepID=A0A506PGN9_9FLAO|nr:Holliday junction resolvase RuvX [Paucihalobacter ruber]TPV32996.1 Holliday junction resolvase RuvX [Paucihalobacter ruber]
MKRIIAFDFGQKRTGIAVTDPLQIIASGLTTINSENLIIFLKDYLKTEPVERFVIGEPKSLINQETHSSNLVKHYTGLLKQHFPDIPITMVDERFTSKMAFQSMIDSGLSKKQRQNKALVDEISATIILQSYLSSLN